MGFINGIKSFIGMDEDEYYEDDEYMEEEDYEEDEPKKRFGGFRAPKVVPVHSGASSKVRIIKPNSFDESAKIADETKANRLVIFDVTSLDADEARRIVDFIAGAVYALNGNVRRVSGGIFVAAPSHIDITGDNLKEQTKNSFDWTV
ncbi:MAG: cell division protein SepF [Clostridia bacterium]|nr:cell division protein SepF [Clostridia bacterium]